MCSSDLPPGACQCSINATRRSAEYFHIFQEKNGMYAEMRPVGRIFSSCILFGLWKGLAECMRGSALFFMHARRSPRRLKRGKNFRIEFSRRGEMRRRSLLRREDSAKPNPKGAQASARRGVVGAW